MVGTVLAWLAGLIVLGLVGYLLVACAFVVRQQHVAVIERLGKFNRIVDSGLHFKLPLIERLVYQASLLTSLSSFQIDVKTKDNVTIGLTVSVQHKVNNAPAARAQESGVYKSFYQLAEPLRQMQDMVTDALRSTIPKNTLDEVFEAKDSIAYLVRELVQERMAGYGFDIVNVLITEIQLPKQVENSMNRINAAERDKAATQFEAEALRIKRVTEAEAEAEAMRKTGEGIAAQRVAIAEGIKNSLETIKESGVSVADANRLFEFTQHNDMMVEMARQAKASTIVLPYGFEREASVFAQQMVAETVANQHTVTHTHAGLVDESRLGAAKPGGGE